MNTKTIFVLVVCFALCFVPATVATGQDGPKQKEENATQARLGIAVSPLPEVLTSHLPDVINKERGILVSDVMEDSPARKAGLKKYDVLVSYGDQDLYSPEQLVKRVRNDQPGSVVEIQYLRGGKLEKATVKLGEEKSKEPVYLKWPNLGSTLKFPWSQLRPKFLDGGSGLWQ